MNTMTSKKVLIVEDDEALSTILADRLLEEGHQVFKAFDGQQGLEFVRKESLDLILLDILMPRMDGMEMMQNVRKLESGKTIPIIIISNLNPNDQMLVKILEFQPAYYLIKSDVKIDEIIDKVNDLLNKK